MTKKRIGILTGGGDVQPLNAVIFAAQQACKKSGIELIGFRNGWQGVLQSSIVQLSKRKIDPAIGGTLLRSSRVNLAATPNGAQTALRNLEQLGISGLIVVGGEDTLSNAFHLKDFPLALISKTIDNDVGIIGDEAHRFRSSDIINYFTLGYPTAASKISSFVSLQEGMRTTAYSHERIIVVESMGMHAGWLALASSMGHPDFIVLPEFPLRYEHFLGCVAERYRSQKHVIIVIAEGARWENGGHLSADDSEKDSFGHPRFKGSADVLARKLKEDLKPQFDTRNVNGVNPSYLYRSGSPCALDAASAAKLGKKAVSVLSKKMHSAVLVTIQKTGAGFSASEYPLSDTTGIEDLHRFVDAGFYSAETYTATKEARSYLSRIVPEFKIIHYST